MPFDAVKVLSKLNEAIVQLNKYRTIPLTWRKDFEDRFRITVEPPNRQPRRVTKGEDKEWNQRWKHKRAHIVYSDILIQFPGIYIAFILVISPSACRSFDVSSFRQQYNQQQQRLTILKLSSDAHQFLDSISENSKFDQHDHYKTLISLLFPDEICPAPKPISAAESGVYFSYNAAKTNAVPYTFGVKVHDFVESAPARIREISTIMLPTTECVRTIFAQEDLQDGILLLDIGRADELAKILFPNIVLTLSEVYPDEHTKDGAYFTLIGASIQALISLVPPRLYEAIDTSDLRAWEKEHFLLETTDCVTLKAFREKPHRGILSIRIGYVAGFLILSELY